MANCSGIFQSQTISCDDPLVAGVVQRLFVANLEDIATKTYSAVAGEENVITAITMKSGKAFFELAGVNQTISAQTDIVRGTLATSYKHTVGVSVFEVDNVSVLNVQAMAYKPQVAIVLGVDDSSLGNGAFQMFGVSAGMDVAANTRINGDTDTGAAWVLSLETPESGRTEPTLPELVWSTNYATTLALVEALKTPA